MTKYLLLLPVLTGCIIVEGDKSEQSDWEEWDSGWDESDGWEESDDWEYQDIEEEELARHLKTQVQKMSMEHIISCPVKRLQEMYFYQPFVLTTPSTGLKL